MVGHPTQISVFPRGYRRRTAVPYRKPYGDENYLSSSTAVVPRGVACIHAPRQDSQVLRSRRRRLFAKYFAKNSLVKKNEKPVPSCKAGRREDSSDVARANFCGGEEQDLLKILLYASLKSRQTVANEAIACDTLILKLIIIKKHSFSLSEKIF